MGQKVNDQRGVQQEPRAEEQQTPSVRLELLAKSTGELELALIGELRRMDLSGSLPVELSEKLSYFNALERQARTGMRFGMVIDREELTELRVELRKARSSLIDLCLNDIFANRWRSVA